MLDENDPALSPEGATATDPQVEEEIAESPEGSEAGEGSGTSSEGQEAKPDELEVVVDGEAAKAEELPKDAAAWAGMRTRERELRAKVAQLEREQQARAQPAAADPGPEPTLEACGWDEAVLKQKHVTWLKATDAREMEKAKAAQQAATVQRKWDDTKASIIKARAELIAQMPGYKDAEAIVDSALNKDQLQIIMRVCKDKTPLVIAALGRDPARLKDLAGEDDTIDFMGKVKELEGKVKTQKKGTTPPPPERKVSGSGTGAKSGADSREDQLRERAMESGDSTELRAYQRAKAKRAQK